MRADTVDLDVRIFPQGARWFFDVRKTGTSRAVLMGCEASERACLAAIHAWALAQGYAYCVEDSRLRQTCLN
jgi:hypothetical protein